MAATPTTSAKIVKGAKRVSVAMEFNPYCKGKQVTTPYAPALS